MSTLQEVAGGALRVQNVERTFALKDDVVRALDKVFEAGTAKVLPTKSAGELIGFFLRLMTPIGFFWY